MEKIIEIAKSSSSGIEFVQPRSTIEVHLPDGRVLSGPRDVPVGRFMAAIADSNVAPIVGAVVNGELRELTYPVAMDSRVRPVTMADADGARIYRRSITFLLEVTFEVLYPEASLTVDHSVSSGGFYCHVGGRPPLSLQELASLEQKMVELVEADLPFTRQVVPLQEAVDYFQEKGLYDKVRLLSYRQKNFLVLYSRLGTGITTTGIWSLRRAICAGSG